VSPVSYSYSRIESKSDWSKLNDEERISILGLWQPDEGFEYALACGSFNSSSYITVMDWVADKAAKTPAQTERLTVVVQDNGSAHQPGDSATVATMAGTGIILFFTSTVPR